MPVLHEKEAVFSARHVPSWLMLTFAAGSVNAIAAIACERYVTHVTGTVTRIGMEAAHVGLLLDFAAVVLAFVAGAIVSAVLINGRVHRNKPPLYGVALFIVAMITGVVGIVGHAGLLGAFGGAPDEAADFVFLSALSFASGLQNASVATGTGALVRTTHLTGPATDLGVHLVEMCFARGDSRRLALQHVLLRVGKIAAFATGAGVGALSALRVGYLAFMTPAVVISVATILSFVPYHRRIDALADAE